MWRLYDGPDNYHSRRAEKMIADHVSRRHYLYYLTFDVSSNNRHRLCNRRIKKARRIETGKPGSVQEIR